MYVYIYLVQNEVLVITLKSLCVFMCIHVYLCIRAMCIYVLCIVYTYIDD